MIVIVAASQGAAAESQPTTSPAQPRIIAVDMNAVRGPRSTVYRQCVGAGRLGEGLRADWQAQLKLCRDEIGFESLRCHGLFHDELGVYRQDRTGNPIYNWQYIDEVYDYLLSIGVRPFVELGFMPEALATIRSGLAGPDGMAPDPSNPKTKRRVTVFQWHANVTPPRDIAQWKALVSATVQHWTDRYGTDEVKRWHFEIWNEPNYPAFWSPEVEANRAQEYFALYSATAQAVKQVNADYQVGGPATAGPAYIDQLIAYSNKNDVPLDFISFHAYGLGGGRGGLDEFGNSFLYLDSNPLSVAAAANSQSQTIAKSAKPSLPVYITEWSTSYSSRDPVHDHYISAPFILEQLKNTESLAGMSYWTFTDVFEEAGVPPRPFHGGFGLLTLQGIKKPAYFAYQFLNRLGEKELANSDEHSWVARDGTGGAQALFWNLSIPPQPRPANQILFRQVREPPDLPPVELTIKGLTPGAYHAAVYRVGFEKNDAYTAYLKMGMPPDLSREQAVELKLIAGGQPDVEHDVNVTSDGKWSTSLPMRQNDVVLVMLEPTTAR